MSARAMPAEEIPVQEVLRLQEEGRVVLVDLRSPGEFAQGHPAGALSVLYSARGLAERIRLVLPPDVAVVLLASAETELESARTQLLESGAPKLAGLLQGGLEGWRQAGLPVQDLGELSVHDLQGLLAYDDMPIVVDVREPLEWEMGHVPGATLISLGELPARHTEIDSAATIHLICEAGVRSCTAASILQAHGFSRVVNIVEGTGGYRSAGYPLQHPTM